MEQLCLKCHTVEGAQGQRGALGPGTTALVWGSVSLAV